MRDKYNEHNITISPIALLYPDRFGVKTKMQTAHRDTIEIKFTANLHLLP